MPRATGSRLPGTPAAATDPQPANSVSRNSSEQEDVDEQRGGFLNPETVLLSDVVVGCSFCSFDHIMEDAMRCDVLEGGTVSWLHNLETVPLHSDAAFESKLGEGVVSSHVVGTDSHGSMRISAIPSDVMDGMINDFLVHWQEQRRMTGGADDEFDADGRVRMGPAYSEGTGSQADRMSSQMSYGFMDRDDSLKNGDGEDMAVPAGLEGLAGGAGAALRHRRRPPTTVFENNGMYGA